MSSNEPWLARAAAYTAAKADPAVLGLAPFIATRPLYSGLSRSAKESGQVLTRAASQPIDT